MEAADAVFLPRAINRRYARRVEGDGWFEKKKTPQAIWGLGACGAPEVRQEAMIIGGRCFR